MAQILPFFLSRAFGAYDVLVGRFRKRDAQEVSVRELGRSGGHSMFAFPTVSGYATSKTAYVSHIDLVTFKLLSPDINDCIFAKELKKLQAQHRIIFVWGTQMDLAETIFQSF